MILSCSLLLLSLVVQAQENPLFTDPAFQQVDGQSWFRIDALSDEFDEGDQLDLEKWLISPETYQGWRGRVPGIFAKEAISLQNGMLRIRASVLPDSIPVKKGPEVRHWTHQGGLVRSKQEATYGSYFECRMKANATFMSSTFWLINEAHKAGSGCDRRVTELDIQECVGNLTTEAKWAHNFEWSMHSNTHDRRPAHLDCSPNQSNGQNRNLANGKVHEDFHVYGAWWKSPTEVLFFLDGIFQFNVTPPANFDLPMHLMMVVETYDWNPPKAGADGMDLPESQRYTQYDWVRSWRLGAQKTK